MIFDKSEFALNGEYWPGCGERGHGIVVHVAWRSDRPRLLGNDDDHQRPLTSRTVFDEKPLKRLSAPAMNYPDRRLGSYLLPPPEPIVLLVLLPAPFAEPLRPLPLAWLFMWPFVPVVPLPVRVVPIVLLPVPAVPVDPVPAPVLPVELVPVEPLVCAKATAGPAASARLHAAANCGGLGFLDSGIS
jgi:hypothetical protein